MWLVAALACAPEPGEENAESAADSAGPPVPLEACATEPLLQLVDEFDSSELPDLESHERTQQGVALGDLDGDGWLDAFMAYGGGSAIFLNDGAGVLRPAPGATADGGPLPVGRAVALADLDADGDLDVYVGRDREAPGLILTNEGGLAFTAAELPDSAQAAATGAFGDFDGDGDLDLYVAATRTVTDATEVIDGTVRTGDGDRLFLQGADGSWTDETAARVPADTSHGWTFQGAPLDHDGDGDLDLYLAHDMGAYITPNVLLENDGTGHFTRATDCDCELVMFAMGAAVGDANADGRPDLYLTDIGGPDLLLNLGDGTFAEAAQALGADIPAGEQNLTSWGATFVDLNQDSFPDLAVTFGQLGQPDVIGDLEGIDPAWVDGSDQRSVLLTGGPDGRFTRRTEAWPGAANQRAVAVGDLDRDGDPDLVAAGKYFLRQWRTDGACGPGVRVVLHGPGRNPQAIGARVEVSVSGNRIVQWALPSTTGSSNAPELYFGVGTEGSFDGGTVTWPDGSMTTFGAARAGATVEVGAE